MLSGIIDWSLRHRALVLAATGFLIATGLYSLYHLPIDAFPDTTPVQVQINTSAPDLSPEEIERQVTFPVEQAISGLKGLTEVRSLSKFGLSQITVIFEDGTDLYLARQLILERMTTVEIPAGIPSPQMGPIATGLGEVLHFIVTGQRHSLTELRTILDWIIKPQLRTVEGVAEVNSWGGREKQYQVVVRPERLIKYDLTLDDLTRALRENNANVGGGQITVGGGTMLVHGVGRVTSLSEIEDIVVATRSGVAVYVRDLGDVVEGYEIRRGAVTYGGEGEAVLGLGFMLMGENPYEVTQRLKEQLETVKRSLPEGVNVATVYDRTELVDHVLHTVRTNLFEGALLVIVVLFVFLGHFRAGLIVALAIPLSMLFAGNMMLRVGIAGSLMSLGAIDFGLIVDSSVIMVENGMRRLTEDGGRRPAIDVVREAALEVRRPTMFGELIIMIVYLPILALEGMEGRLFRPMALTVVFALLGSLILSLTLMPVLASLVLPRRVRAHAHAFAGSKRASSHVEPWLIRMCKRLYEPILERCLHARGTIVVVAGAMLVTGVVLALRLGTVFIPRLSEEAVVINTIRLAGVSLDESVRYGTRIEQLLLKEFPDEIRHIWSRTGTAEVATDPMGLELTDVFMSLHPRSQWTKARTQEELVLMMDAELSVMPGMRMVFTQPIELRVNEMIAGVRSDLGIKIFGDDFATLKGLAGKVETVMDQIPGTADLVTEQLTGQPVFRVTLRRDQLARHGVSASEVLSMVAAIGRIETGHVQEGEMRFPLVVRLPEAYRADPRLVADLIIHTARGQRLPLSGLADIAIVEGPSTINREWGKRRIITQCNVRGQDLGGFVREARERLDRDLELPAGYFIRFGGQFEHLERASRRLMFVVPIALSLVFVLLYATYGRWMDCVRIFMTLPLAAVGGIVALTLRDMPFSVSAGVGFVAMSGVSVLGDMVFVSHLRGLLDQGIPLAAAVRETAITRLRPVLMTGLVAGLGFVPMALSTGVGAEVQRPLATVVIGCVATSTVLTLLVLPVMYTFFARGQSKVASAA